MLERFEEFTFSIYEIQRCWTKLASEGMEVYGLKGSCAVYLLAMRRFPGGVTAARLGSLCGRDKADVSRAVAVLQSKGLVEKTDGGKKKSYRAGIVLTEQGRLLTEEIAKRAEYAESIAGAGLSDDERKIMYSALEKIRGNLKSLEKDGIPVKCPEEGLPAVLKLY